MSLFPRTAARLLCLPARSIVSRPRNIFTIAAQKPLRTPVLSVAQPFLRRFLAEEATSRSEESELSEDQSAETAASEIYEEPADIAAPLAPEPEAPVKSAEVAEEEKQLPEFQAGERFKKLTFGSSSGDPPEPSNVVYVGNLFFDVRAPDLKKEFEKVGPVVSSRIVEDFRGLSKGFGYIQYASVEHAAKAIAQFNLQPFEGRRIAVQYAKPSNRPEGSNLGTPAAPNPPSRTLFIGNLSFDLSDRELREVFSEIGSTEVRVAIDRRTGQPRGFAHADFDSVAEATAAKEKLSTLNLHGRQIRVDYTATSHRANLTKVREMARDRLRASSEE